MDLADLFQQSERLWAENERVRRRLNETLRQARRSLGQHPGFPAAEWEPEISARRDDGARKQEAAPEADSDP